ncbi:uncharacterized protein [Panulirus ornatus]|uniref:uncharacterized protein isoform X2 n=1 Tax=Panulirus ornatus TaxID=150431 RepID=UPI003A8B19FF
MLTMKMLRFRFRNIVGLVVLLTVAFLLLSLPPSARSPRLLLDGFTHSAPTHPPLILVQAGTGPRDQVEYTPRSLPSPAAIVKSPTVKGRAKVNSTEVVATNLTSALDRANSGSDLPIKALDQKTFEETAEKDVVPNDDVENEHDSYVQDYTPADFVEVKKIKPVTKKSRVELNQKRPAVLNRPRGFDTSAPTSKYTPQMLKDRALSFSNSSALRMFLAEQERRAHHVASTCMKLLAPVVDANGSGRGPPRGLISGKDIIFDRKNHLAFCPVYKAASTSWTITLLEIGGYWSKKLKKTALQKVVRQYYPRISNFAAASLTNDAIRFMVVRHPFERLLSCYRDKYENASKDYYYLHYGEKMVRRYRKFPPYLTSSQLGVLQEQVRAKIKAGLPVVLSDNPFAKPLGPTFEEFVQFVIDTRHDDEHWRTYFTHCAPCYVPYNFILRFESLYEEGLEFLEYLNRTSIIHPRWDNPTRGATTGEVFCSYFNQLSLEQIDRLCVKYERDFKLYEYSPDAYRKCAKDYKDLNATTKVPEKA